MTQAELGMRCRELRERAGLSQVEAARVLGLDQSMLSRVETGERRIDTLSLQRFAEAYGVPPTAFFERPLVSAPLPVLLRQAGALDGEARADLTWLQAFVEEYVFLRTAAAP